jgi:hypothetical protein
MPQFIMEGVLEPDFQDLPELTQGYIEAVFFTEHDPSVTLAEWQAEPDMEFMDGSIPHDVGFCELAPDTLKAIEADCGAFHVKARDLLHKAYERGYDRAYAGHDFWLTRNGHGAGFWDRTELDADGLGDALTEIAESFGQVWTYIGDDGLIYIQ